LQLGWKIRCFLLNRRPGIHVSEQARYIARTAQLQTNPDRSMPNGQIYISRGVRISDGVILASWDGTIFLDEGVFIGPYCVLYGQGGLVIGKNALIAAHTVCIPGNHIFSDPSVPINRQGASLQGINIGEDVWVGCGVRILDGVRIGRGCVIGAGAVVTQSLVDYSIAVGVPARVIGNRKEIGPKIVY
jgi:acetyltransferase-like isoleucine patch superfamily enzyme